MRFSTTFGSAFVAFSLALSTFGADAAPPAPEGGVEVVASWPENNQIGHVVNGQKNTLNIFLQNKSSRNLTVHNIAASVHNSETDKLVKNLTTQTITAIKDVGTIQIPLAYTFFSELKPGDLRLHVWVEYTSGGEKVRSTAYDSIVSVVEPKGSIFDLKLLISYLITAAFLGGSGYFVFLQLGPQNRKPRAKRAPAPVVPETTDSAPGTPYNEEWIPEHHLRKAGSKKKGGAVSGTSGDEFSGAEAGAELKRRKSKK